MIGDAAVWLRDYPAPSWERRVLHAASRILDCQAAPDSTVAAQTRPRGGDERTRAADYARAAARLREHHASGIVADVADILDDLSEQVRRRRLDELVRRYS